MRTSKLTNEQRFWLKVDKRGPDECWEWKELLSIGGYGRFYFKKDDGKLIQIYAHRLSYELSTGDILKEKKCCHRCDNPKCVNPSHLFSGTQLDNIRDALKKGRFYTGDHKGELNGRSKLSTPQVKCIRELSKAGSTCVFLGKIFRVAHSTVNRISTGKYWSNICQS